MELRNGSCSSDQSPNLGNSLESDLELRILTPLAAFGVTPLLAVFGVENLVCFVRIAERVTGVPELSGAFVCDSKREHA